MATCTAPGHSSCTITCPNGCIALYYEPNGPCRTSCSGSAVLDIDASQKFSVQISDMPATDLEKAIGPSLGATIQSALKASSKSVSLSLQSVGVKELTDAIKGAI